MAHLTVQLIILRNTDAPMVHTYLGTNPKKIDSLLAQVICPKFMAVMWNPWCLQDCHYLNNLACALRILFGFGKMEKEVGFELALRGGGHESWELDLGENVSILWFWISRRQLIITYLLSKNLYFCRTNTWPAMSRLA